MKKTLNVIMLSIVISMLMSSCYTQKYMVGEGSQTGVETKEKNNYFLFGLVDGKISDPKNMANGVENYSVTTEMTFVDGLLSALTWGIYSPTTTKVQK